MRTCHRQRCATTALSLQLASRGPCRIGCVPFRVHDSPANGYPRGGRSDVLSGGQGADQSKSLRRMKRLYSHGKSSTAGADREWLEDHEWIEHKGGDYLAIATTHLLPQ
uniref:Uncharacterized protein n=1 Tax=Oryza rufipogon TaxID=4529 RepID=A0A0E0P1E3_ORYRU